jgi:hypothetical protein
MRTSLFSGTTLYDEKMRHGDAGDLDVPLFRDEGFEFGFSDPSII